MKFRFTNPGRLLFIPENAMEMYELGRMLGKTELPYILNTTGEMGKSPNITDVTISVKDLWSYLMKEK